MRALVVLLFALGLTACGTAFDPSKTYQREVQIACDAISTGVSAASKNWNDLSASVQQSVVTIRDEAKPICGADAPPAGSVLINRAVALQSRLIIVLAGVL